MNAYDEYQKPIHEVAAELNSHLGPTMVAIMCGVADYNLPRSWGMETAVIELECQKRLRLALQVWSFIELMSGARRALIWFQGDGRLLDESESLRMIRDTRIDLLRNCGVRI
jgi:hypothetical protein